MFLATFLIGLREGLEATIIVGVLAAFMRRNNEKITSVVVGALVAVLVSIAVGVGLMLSAHSLPQAQQEALETIIGVIAVIFVTTMILWMNKHARAMKASLEAEAALSIAKGGARALAIMAFLAVLKEGFETAVFLLAALNAGGNTLYGLSGALLGIMLAIFLGYLIYYGGVKFNLSTFFKITGPFLVVIAAGFVANAFRTAHEAGWINIGQAQVFDFSALINNENVFGAIIQGMFSIQSDPRLIEVMGWFAYLLPVLVIYLWPKRLSFTHEQAQRIRLGASATCAIAALGLFIFVPKGTTDVLSSHQTIKTSDTTISASLVSHEEDYAIFDIDGMQIRAKKVREGLINNAQAYTWEEKELTPLSNMPETISITELTTLNNSKLPSGINRQRHSGPFHATWTQQDTYTATTVGSGLLSISKTSLLIANLSEGGLSSPRLVSIRNDEIKHGLWETSSEVVEQNKNEILQAWYAAEELKLWWLMVPIASALVALGLCATWAYHRKIHKDMNVTQIQQPTQSKVLA